MWHHSTCANSLPRYTVVWLIVAYFFFFFNSEIKEATMSLTVRDMRKLYNKYVKIILVGNCGPCKCRVGIKRRVLRSACRLKDRLCRQIFATTLISTLLFQFFTRVVFFFKKPLKIFFKPNFYFNYGNALTHEKIVFL